MTAERLLEIRARVAWLEENGGIGLPFNEVRALLDEVERLKAENIKQFRQGAELMQSAILYILHDYNIDPQAIADIVQMDYPVRPEDWAKRPRSET